MELISAIAAAVEEQGAATQEIARNVQETGESSAQVLEAANELSKQSETLQAEIEKFMSDD